MLRSPAVVAYEIPESVGTRREHFELRRGGELVGVVASLFGEGQGRAERDLRAELRFDLWSIQTRVHHVETRTPRGPRLVWREQRQRSGRTVLFEWSEDGDRLVQVDWGGGDGLRRESPAETGALLPLFLVASVRAGAFPRGRFDVVDPPSGSVAELAVHVRRVPWIPGSGLSARCLVLRRTDGSLAGQYLFLGKELIGFRFQEGGPVALRVSSMRFREHEAAEAERRAEEAEAAAVARAAGAKLGEALAD
jgi:hypothetical protein